MRTTASVLCFLFSASIAIGWADDIVNIRRSNEISGNRSANTVLVVRIEKHNDNRELGITCESDAFYTSSAESLDGENTPREIRFGLNLYEGQYECRAILSRNINGKKKHFSATTKFLVY